ncbi:FliM/FliN family flagellar motor switch protein [Rhodobacteraceae bacterium W635]|uniref:FliM/FliN family flagellar motor switch protein n=1 Tax=Nioella halotolerans TaxID=2303578 RepID=UPI000E3EE200|nr:FliM/FliN family flagellar motor switch protein [Rhodobacteraceae bacterium W635]
MPDETRPTTGAAGSLRSVPVEIRVSVGRAHPTISDLLALSKEDILALDRRIEDPVELYIGDRLVASGELVEADSGGLGVRITELADGGHG